ncbi:MAG: hypothetical protein P8M30_04835 [Planctomycetaceae bacterium]|nr:hypothetical protein [Planctomycetaceae bacterium]
MLNTENVCIPFVCYDHDLDIELLVGLRLSDSWRLGVTKQPCETHLPKHSLPELAFVVRLTATRSLVI